MAVMALIAPMTRPAPGCVIRNAAVPIQTTSMNHRASTLSIMAKSIAPAIARSAMKSANKIPAIKDEPRTQNRATRPTA